MLSSKGRIATRRLSSSAFGNARIPASRSIAGTSPRIVLSSPNALRPLTAIRHYAAGRPRPPGGTHRMNLGGEPEKAALEAELESLSQALFEEVYNSVYHLPAITNADVNSIGQQDGCDGTN